MSDPAGAAFVLLMAAGLGLKLNRMLASGKTATVVGIVERTRQPVAFWASIILVSMLTAFMLLLAALVSGLLR